MVNPLISECSKLAQKIYKSRHDWVGTVQEIKINHADKWHMLKPETLLVNGMHKIIWVLLRYKRITQSRPEDLT